MLWLMPSSQKPVFVWMAILACCACSSKSSPSTPHPAEDAAIVSTDDSGTSLPTGDDSGTSSGDDSGSSSGDDSGSSGDGGDASAEASAGNPCAKVPAADNGSYCATTTQYGFDPSQADGTSIYNCQNGKVSGMQACANGCLVAAAGTPDTCK
jgi:hypothetical protein